MCIRCRCVFSLDALELSGFPISIHIHALTVVNTLSRFVKLNLICFVFSLQMSVGHLSEESAIFPADIFFGL